MEPFIGQIQAFGFNFAPRGWAFCNGQLLPINQHSALFSLLGTTYGGDGRTSFALPDLRGRSIVHVGNGPGLDQITQGERGGTPYVVLNTNHLPSHNHTAQITKAQLPINSDSGNIDADDPDGAFLCAQANDTYASAATTGSYAGSGPDQTITVGNTGGSQSLNIRNPFLGIYVCIALEGIFPSRS